MAHTATALRPGRKQLILLVLGVVALYLLIPQFGAFRHSLKALESADRQQLLVAFAWTAAMYLFAAGTYCLLAIKALRYSRTLLVQVASNFANRLLPAGIGGISVNYAYLRKSRHTPTQAAAVVTANNLLGIVGHVLLTVLLLTIFRSQLAGLKLSYDFGGGRWRYALVAGGVIVLALAISKYQQRVKAAIAGVLRQLFAYRRHPRRIGLALVTSMALTFCNILSLYYCVHALHLAVPFVTVLVIFSVGTIIGTATPTPGGLGGAEAGLVAGLVLYHVTAADALAAVLAYRFISYWLALLAGALAFLAATKRDYFLFKL